MKNIFLFLFFFLLLFSNNYSYAIFNRSPSNFDECILEQMKQFNVKEWENFGKKQAEKVCKMKFETKLPYEIEKYIKIEWRIKDTNTIELEIKENSTHYNISNIVFCFCTKNEEASEKSSHVLETIRREYPEYANYNDEDLTFELWKGASGMDWNEFRVRIGLEPEPSEDCFDFNFKKLIGYSNIASKRIDDADQYNCGEFNHAYGIMNK